MVTVRMRIDDAVEPLHTGIAEHLHKRSAVIAVACVDQHGMLCSPDQYGIALPDIKNADDRRIRRRHDRPRLCQLFINEKADRRKQRQQYRCQQDRPFSAEGFPSVQAAVFAVDLTNRMKILFHRQLPVSKKAAAPKWHSSRCHYFRSEIG